MYGLATKKQQPTLSLFVAPNLNTSKQARLSIFHGVEGESCSDFPDSETGTNKLWFVATGPSRFIHSTVCEMLY